jgi:hypothetical protein
MYSTRISQASCRINHRITALPYWLNLSNEVPPEPRRHRVRFSSHSAVKRRDHLPTARATLMKNKEFGGGGGPRPMLKNIQTGTSLPLPSLSTNNVQPSNNRQKISVKEDLDRTNSPA